MRTMRTAYTISAVGHAAVLLWSVWSLSATSLPVSSTEGLPVDLVTASDFSKITAGSKDAPKAETAKPLVEKIAEANPVEDPTAKVVEKKEVKAAREPPPAPEAKPAEPGPQKKPARGPARPDRRRARKGRSQEPRAEKGRRQAADPAKEARPTDAQVRSQAGCSVARQARLDAARRRRRDPQQRALARLVERRRGAPVPERTGTIAHSPRPPLDPTPRRT